MPRRIAQWYFKWMASHPIMTNMASGVVMAGIGDVACQALEGDHPYAFRRTVELAATRIVITPLLVRWYGILNARLPGTAMRMVVSRVACDQLIWAPIFMCVFFPTIALSRGESLGGAVGQLKDRFWPALMTNYCIWPAFHLINFRFVPIPMQVLATTGMSTVWNGVLSHIARPDQEDSAFAEATEQDDTAR